MQGADLTERIFMANAMLAPVYQYTYWDPAAQIQVIARPKLNLPGEHWGLLLPGMVVIHLGVDGIRLESLAAFLCGHSHRTVKTAKAEDHPQILLRARDALANPPAYHLFAENCEVFANRLYGDSPQSPQVTGALILVTLTALALRS